MKPPEKNYRSYLWKEADTYGQHYEQALEKLFAVTERSAQPGSDLLVATQAVQENLRLYCGALRRIATIAVRESNSADEHLFAHA